MNKEEVVNILDGYLSKLWEKADIARQESCGSVEKITVQGEKTAYTVSVSKAGDVIVAIFNIVAGTTELCRGNCWYVCRKLKETYPDITRYCISCMEEIKPEGFSVTLLLK